MFRLRTFGGLTLERDGVPYTGPATQRRRLAVLAMLAASETGVSRDRLTEYLWPGADPARGRHSLDEALSALRREFRSDSLFLGVASLRLNADVLASDLADYAAAVKAGDAERTAALYAGPFLDGFYVPGTVDFEQWVEAERGRRCQTHLRALERFATDAAARGDGTAVVRWRETRVALDPLDTPAVLGLLAALTAAGHPAEALRAARVHEALVREELDSAPGREWAAAVEGIRAELTRPPDPPVVVAAVNHVEQREAAVVPRDVVPRDVVPRDSAAAGAAMLAPAIDDVVSDTLPAAGGRGPPGGEAREAGSTRAPAIERRWRARAIGAAGGGVLVVATIVATWASRPATSGDGAPAAAARITAAPGSVAVLPFANTSGDPADEPFSDGLTDELIGTLSRVAGVRVTGRTSAFALKARGLSVRTIADTLGVATVLEGSVRRAGDRFRITAQLVSAADNGVLWSGTYDRELQDIFAVQAEIARAIVAALMPALGDRPGSVRPIRTRDLVTYELYLTGRYFLGRRTPGDLRRAVDYFERAVARDSTYADAYAGLADARVLLVLLADRPPREEVPRARSAAATAIRLDPKLAEAHAALGNIHEAFDWDGRAADHALARAVALDSGYATARLYRGIHLLHRGRLDEALAELAEARALDPLSAPVRMQIGRAHVAAHRPDHAVASLLAAVELSPEFSLAHGHLGDAYLQQGRAVAALGAFRRAAALNGARDSAQLAYALAATGDRDAAQRLLTKLLAEPRRPYQPPIPVAMAYAALGDADGAFRWLERGVAERAALMRTINVTPAFRPLHADRRWMPLLRRVGLEP